MHKSAKQKYKGKEEEKSTSALLAKLSPNSFCTLQKYIIFNSRSHKISVHPLSLSLPLALALPLLSFQTFLPFLFFSKHQFHEILTHFDLIYCNSVECFVSPFVTWARTCFCLFWHAQCDNIRYRVENWKLHTENTDVYVKQQNGDQAVQVKSHSAQLHSARATYKSANTKIAYRWIKIQMAKC